jgi:ribosomal protein S18 acetylase RimI-like enzyme
MFIFNIEKIYREKISNEEFQQIVKIEKSNGEDAYSEDVLKEIFIDDIKDDNFVCRYNNQIVGYISYNPLSKRRNGSVYIINLVVDPQFRRQGIAQKLIYETAMYYLNKGEPKIMSLQVDKNNYPAINLYKKMGFEIVDPICKLDEDDEQYIMEIEVAKLSKNNSIDEANTKSNVNIK